jgi:hypothetical protein
VIWLIFKVSFFCTLYIRNNNQGVRVSLNIKQIRVSDLKKQFVDLLIIDGVSKLSKYRIDLIFILEMKFDHGVRLFIVKKNFKIRRVFLHNNIIYIYSFDLSLFGALSAHVHV